MSRVFAALRSVFCLAALILTTSCGEELTQFFVCYEIAPDLVADSTVVHACVRDADGNTIFGCGDSELSLGRTGETATQSIVGNGEVDITLSADVTRAGPGGTTRVVPVEQRVVATLEPGRIIDLRLRLEAVCLERACDAGETCVGGECRAAEVTARCLTAHGEPPPDRCDDPRLEGGCSAR